ncbi:uncharacterized protein LOC131298420 [Rhododendron vialii]|uniref:uncharacterized protein LOC131298420 n=1 Tax=Rhododendron vialii TaxID=182163 RepID=UPI00265DA591|nr:uncharacterized protein LOC131298420 [Rhododendron vialii]
MGSSSRRSLELKLMGCKGLQAFNFFQKLKVFAVVSLTSDTPGNKHHHPLQQQQQRTKTDAEGDKDPEWNHEMRFDLDAVGREDCDHLYLHIDLRYEFFGDKSLGEVRVPLTDLVCDSATGLGEHGENCGVARFVSYEVRTHEKKPNGVITFSYKVVNPLHGVGGSATAAATATTTATTTTTYGYIDGYTVVTPVDDHHHHHHSNHDQNTTAAAASGYSTVNHVNGDLLHQQQQQNQNQHHHHHHQSDHDHDQHLQSPYGRADQEFSYHYSAVESTAYGIHYPSLEPPPYLPMPAGEGYMSYSRFDHHQFQYPPPPPPFHPPPELTRISSHPFPPPQPPPPELTRISSDPFPPPQPPLHHHHHHHHHAAHGAVYPPPSTGDLYEQSYGMSSSIYYNGDGTPRY